MGVEGIYGSADGACVARRQWGGRMRRNRGRGAGVPGEGARIVAEEIEISPGAAATSSVSNVPAKFSTPPTPVTRWCRDRGLFDESVGWLSVAAASGWGQTSWAGGSNHGAGSRAVERRGPGGRRGGPAGGDGVSRGPDTFHPDLLQSSVNFVIFTLWIQKWENATLLNDESENNAEKEKELIWTSVGDGRAQLITEIKRKDLDGCYFCRVNVYFSQLFGSWRVLSCFRKLFHSQKTWSFSRKFLVLLFAICLFSTETFCTAVHCSQNCKKKKQTNKKNPQFSLLQNSLFWWRQTKRAVVVFWFFFGSAHCARAPGVGITHSTVCPDIAGNLPLVVRRPGSALRWLCSPFSHPGVKHTQIRLLFYRCYKHVCLSWMVRS